MPRDQREYGGQQQQQARLGKFNDVHVFRGALLHGFVVIFRG